MILHQAILHHLPCIPVAYDQNGNHILGPYDRTQILYSASIRNIKRVQVGYHIADGTLHTS